MKRNSVISLTIAGLLLLSGCTDISERTLSDSEATDQQPSGIGGDLLILDGEKGETDDDGEYPSYSFSPQQESFINSCVFMGDGICGGLYSCGLVQSCYSGEDVSAGSISGYAFETDGGRVEPLTALVNSGSKRLVFLLGINDVNEISPEEYAEDYGSFLSKVESSCPEASIYVLSIAPVAWDSGFCSNDTIDSFNLALREMIENSGSAARHYVDAAAYLKDGSGALKPLYGAADGVHLSAAAYYALLYALCEEAGFTE